MSRSALRYATGWDALVANLDAEAVVRQAEQLVDENLHQLGALYDAPSP